MPIRLAYCADTNVVIAADAAIDTDKINDWVVMTQRYMPMCWLKDLRGQHVEANLLLLQKLLLTH